MVKVVLVVVAQYLLPNSSSQREQCGIRSVSIVTNANVRWTLCWHAMDLIRKFTVAPATVDCLDQKVLVTDTPQPYQAMANLQSTGGIKISHCEQCNQLPYYFSVSSIGGARPTDGSGCPRCGFVVFEAEKMISKSNSWHKRCFNCADCHRSLDSTNLCDAPNGEIYW